MLGDELGAMRVAGQKHRFAYVARQQLDVVLFFHAFSPVLGEPAFVE